MNIPCDSVKNRQTNKNLQNPASSLSLINAYISENIEKRLTTPDIPRNTHLSHSIGTTLSAVVIMNMVKE